MGNDPHPTQGTAHPVEQVLGEPVPFFAQQRQRLLGLGIDVTGMPVSHLAYRTPTLEEYLEVRAALVPHCSANVENVWNGRPISKLLLSSPLAVADDAVVSLIELIPPVHENVYKMGLEHVGFVVGPGLEEFTERHRAVLTGRQDQGPYCQPRYIRFEDATNVKFYEHGLQDVCVMEGKRFDGFHHVLDDPS